jgi:hypothetical protein
VNKAFNDNCPISPPLTAGPTIIIDGPKPSLKARSECDAAKTMNTLPELWSDSSIAQTAHSP